MRDCLSFQASAQAQNNNKSNSTLQEQSNLVNIVCYVPGSLGHLCKAFILGLYNTIALYLLGKKRFPKQFAMLTI